VRRERPPLLIVANWKMHGLRRDIDRLLTLEAEFRQRPSRATVVVCPPATLLSAASDLCDGRLLTLGGQTCHSEREGAFTGELSAEMLADAGARYVILGHSERRIGLRETDRQVARKATAAVRAGLTVIVCVGETLVQREAGQTMPALHRQLSRSVPSDLDVSRLVVAYEPVWAIGAGTLPSPAEIEAAAATIRASLVESFGAVCAATPILYGGSVAASNAAEILCAGDVGGLLVGRACLDPAEFLKLIRAADRVSAGPLPQPT
jgi:triosephosphate isomerase